ncbi:Uma2 family endonuclease [Dyadobacter luticola]|uniref:Uma2 family endonuclease n=1 Tax=Dyadobacter luticola TaxID=1979387 RepID=A0A5R9KXU7_9BACT|nr:Uma2 family endonuclease [Dyadobacter luticola]TLV00939.1 Uma2 family endonuclease [Dyadobacter luticola]
MSAQAIMVYSDQEYLKLEREAEYKSEFFKGEIVAMAGAGFNHNRIVENLSGECYIAFKGKSCQTFSSDMRLHIPLSGLYTYPDLVAVCGPIEFLDDKEDTILNPVSIFEVLSPSTSGYDRGEKFHMYRSVPSLKEYVLINSMSVGAEVWKKNGEDLWYLFSEAYNLEGSIEIPGIGLSLEMADIYYNTNNLKFTLHP